MAWVAGYCLVTPLAIVAPSWRWLIFFVSVPQLITASLCYLPLFPESLHYLAIGRHEKIVGEWLNKTGDVDVAGIDPRSMADE
ncbi:hypothetical protein COOONC_10984 [Cooperia oncophora]